MKKMTDYQIENLIENVIQKRNNDKIINLKKIYLKKWNLCETKKERFNFLNEFFLMRKTLISEGYNRRSIDEGIISDLFKSGTKGFVSTFKEWISRKLVGALGIKDPGLQNAIAIGLANLDWSKDWTKLLSPVKNCRYFADVIIDSAMEYYIDKKLNQWIGSGVLASSFRNAISDALTDQKYVQGIQDKVSEFLCGILERMFSGGGIKSALSGMMGGKSAQGAKPSAAPTE